MRNKKKVAIAIVIAFLVTMVLPVSAFAGSFPDVPSTHWAAQSIDRMNARAIVGGYEDGTARPDNPVTEFEAILMASRMMGLEYNADKDAGTVLPFKYPNWPGAYNSAVVAYKAGLIDVKDFTHNAAASREWIAKLLIKILDAEDELSTVKNEKAVFVDSNKIGKAYIDYVKLAYDKRLIGGYPDKTFRPQKTVTRAELSAFLCRVENQLGIVPKGVILGKVSMINGVQIGINGSDGKAYTIKADVNSKLYSISGKKIGVTGLKIGNPVYVVCKNGIVRYLEVRDKETVITTQKFSGVIQEVLATKNLIVLTDEANHLKTIRVDSSTKILQKGTGKVLSLKDLKAGETAVVVVNKDSQLAKEITVEQKELGVNYEGKAIVNAIDKTKHTITFTSAKESQKQTAHYSEGLKVSFANHAVGTVDQLQENDEIQMKVANGEVLSISVNRDLTVKISGNVFSVENDKILLSDRHYYVFAPSIEVYIDGKNAGITDIKSGMSVELTISNDRVIKIESSNLVIGVVKTVNSGSHILSVTTKNGTEIYNVAADPAICFYFAQNKELNVLRPGDHVSMEMENGKVVKINVKAIAEVTITKIDTGNGTVTLKDSSNRIVTVVVKDATITLNGKNATLANLVPYSDATATFDGNSLISLEIK